MILSDVSLLFPFRLQQYLHVHFALNPETCIIGVNHWKVCAALLLEAKLSPRMAPLAFHHQDETSDQFARSYQERIKEVEQTLIVESYQLLEQRLDLLSEKTMTLRDLDL